MPNIFDCFKKANDNIVKDQIVLLRSITLNNMLKLQGQKTLKTATSKLNTITKLFTDKLKINEYKPQTINDIMQKETQKIQDCSRAELDYILKEELQLRAKGSTKDIYSDDEISISIIDKASKMFKDIEDYYTPEQKVDMIKQNFLNRMICLVQNNMKKQSYDEQVKMQRSIQQSLDELSTDSQENIRQILKVDRLTGETVYKALMTTTASTLALNLFGQFGGYIFLTTIMHGLFTTLLGITLPFAVYTTATSALSIITGPIGALGIIGLGAYKLNQGSNKIKQEALAQCIAMAALAYGNKPMTPSLEELPSWVSKDNEDELKIIKQQDLEIERLSKEFEEYKSKYENLSETLRFANKQINEQKEKLYKESTLNEQEKQVAMDIMIELEEEKNQLESKLRSLIEEKEQIEKRLDQKAEKTANMIEDNWKIHFNKFIYSKKFLKEVAKHEYNLRLKLEQALKSLHEVKDPKALSRGNMHNGDCHMAITKAYRLSYKVHNDGRIELKYFHHHKEQDKIY